MRIEVTQDEFMHIVILYLLERMSERGTDISEEFVKLSQESERVLEVMGSRNLETELRRTKQKLSIIDRNKYNFIKKVFSSKKSNDNIILIKQKTEEED